MKLRDKDPLTGSETEVMWIKGSGGDIGTLKKSGCAALYVDRLRSLTNVYRGLEHEDEMVELFNHCIFDLSSKAPSIDTPLHGFLPFKHIDHLHPDAAIAIDGIGSTEMLHIFLSNRPGDVRYGTTGKPVEGYEVELRNEDGSVVTGHDQIGNLS